MSSRQLKKLRAQQELAAQKKAPGAVFRDESEGKKDDEDESNDEDDVDEARPRAKNVFAAFATLGDDGDGEEDDDDDEDNENQQAEDKPHAQVGASPNAPKASKKKKKKKNKGKGVTEATEAPGLAETKSARKTASAASTKIGDSAADLDEIDRALQELALHPVGAGKAAASTSAPAPMRNARAIKINLSDLRVSNELREVFGREAMQSVAAEEAQAVPARPRPAAGMADGEGEGQAGVIQMDLETFLRAPPPPPRGMVYVNANGQRQPTDGAMAAALAKRNPFIQWKNTWPRGTSGGLSMQRVDSRHAAAEEDFCWVHSPAYQHQEDTFLTLVMMHNPQPMIQFLRQHPFHIASLIQISRVAKLQDQNASLASDLCERALFAFGRSALSSFRYALRDGLGGARLSFYRPENRQFVLAGYHYIVSLMGLGTYRTALAWTKLLLTVMPHDEYALLLYAQSLAVRAFEAQWFVDYLGNDDDAPLALTDNPMGEYIRQSLVPALLQTKNAEAARAALARGLARLPWLYGALFQALGLDVPRAVWGITPRNDAETLYTELYLHLAKDLWQGPAARSLLQEVAGTSQKAETRSLPLPPPVNLSIARFVYLDATPGLMALVPQSMLHATPNYDFDPLPPPLEQNIFSNKSQKRPWISAASDAQHQSNAHFLDNFMVPRELLEDWDRVDAEDFGFADQLEDFGMADQLEDFGNETHHSADEEEVQQESAEAQTHEEPQQNAGDGGGGGGGMPGAWLDDDE
ncbi:hypothetical protein SEPCBS119000_003058 [Sporothrix epigloea]|uniref:Nulp1-pending protein n=1 Tax=Sporothrix epigloea TaxID=1892477 RepID=A0ABP0DMA4_9PEZI